MAKKEEKKLTDIELLFLFFICVLKDVSDWILLVLLGVGLVFSRLTTILMTSLIGVWFYVRLGKKFPKGSFTGTSIAEIVPFIGDILPTWIAFAAVTLIQQKEWLGTASKLLSKFK